MGLIYLDACLLIYLTERHARWGGPVADAMARSEGAGFGISPLVKCECLVGPIGNRKFERKLLRSGWRLKPEKSCAIFVFPASEVCR